MKVSNENIYHSTNLNSDNLLGLRDGLSRIDYRP
jgi:hypothetical protein